MPVVVRCGEGRWGGGACFFYPCLVIDEFLCLLYVLGREPSYLFLLVVIRLQLLFVLLSQLLLGLFGTHHLLVFLEETLVAEEQLPVLAVQQQCRTAHDEQQDSAEDEHVKLTPLSCSHLVGFLLLLLELLDVVHLADANEVR